MWWALEDFGTRRRPLPRSSGASTPRRRRRRACAALLAAGASCGAGGARCRQVHGFAPFLAVPVRAVALIHPEDTFGRRRWSPQRAPSSVAAAVPAAFPGLVHGQSWVWLAIFVLVDSGQALTMDWAEKRTWQQKPGRQYVRQTVLVLHSSLAIAVGLVTSFCLGGGTAFRSCFDRGLFLQFLPVSLCFATGLSLKLMAVNHFQAGTIKILGQLRLPFIAIFSTVLLARRYSLLQWQVIGIVTSSCLAFVQLKGQGRESSGKAWKWSGLGQILGWVLLNVLGGIAAEHTYKRGDLPFYVQKVSEDFGHLLIGVGMLFCVVPCFQPEEDILDRSKRPGGFFDGWDMRTGVVVAFLFADAWIGNLLVKEFSGLTRSVTKAFSLSLVYVSSLFYSKDRRRNPALTLVALLVIQSTLLYAFIS